MAPGLMIPDPSANRMAPKGGFAARVSVGTLLMEEVRLVKVEPLGFGSAALTLRSQGLNKREGSMLFRQQILKVLHVVVLYSRHTMTLIFEDWCQQ